ncbi:MAG TPA: helix-turn-helix domain-containing protein [Rhizomicrobium sp.]|nr:helix-turn-helix domain-containing protein [Rhizomicrobium sp.]
MCAALDCQPGDILAFEDETKQRLVRVK